MNEYETIPTRVKAWQAPVDCTIDQESMAVLAASYTKLRVRSGQWVVDHGPIGGPVFNRYEVLSDDEFKAKYRPANITYTHRETGPEVRPWLRPSRNPEYVCKQHETPVGRHEGDEGGGG